MREIVIDNDKYIPGDILVKWIDERWFKLGHIDWENIKKQAQKKILEGIEEGK